MLFIFHIVQCFVFMTVQSIKFNGSCPEIAAEDHFNCNDSIGNSVNLFERYETLVNKYPHDCFSPSFFFAPLSFRQKSFFAMGYLPIENNSLNMFFNPFNRLNCLSFVWVVNGNISIKITEYYCRQFDASWAICYRFTWSFRATFPMIQMRWNFAQCLWSACNPKQQIHRLTSTTWLTMMKFVQEYSRMWKLWSQKSVNIWSFMDAQIMAVNTKKELGYWAVKVMWLNHWGTLMKL